MKSINLIIIPEWQRMTEEKKIYYDRLYEELSADRINVGVAPKKGVFIGMLNIVVNRRDSYLFVLGEEVEEEDKDFIQKELAKIGYGPERIKGINEIVGEEGEVRERLRSWLKDLRSLQGSERIRS